MFTSSAGLGFSNGDILCLGYKSYTNIGGGVFETCEKEEASAH